MRDEVRIEREAFRKFSQPPPRLVRGGSLLWSDPRFYCLFNQESPESTLMVWWRRFGKAPGAANTGGREEFPMRIPQNICTGGGKAVGVFLRKNTREFQTPCFSHSGELPNRAFCRVPGRI